MNYVHVPPAEREALARGDYREAVRLLRASHGLTEDLPAPGEADGRAGETDTDISGAGPGDCKDLRGVTGARGSDTETGSLQMGLTPVNVPALAVIVSCAKGSFTAEQLRWLAGEFGLHGRRR